MEGNAACLILSNNTNNYSNFLSTGYLEDALLDISFRFKRRKLMVFPTNDHLHEYHHHPLPTHLSDDLSYWNNWLTNYSMVNSDEDLSHASNSSSETIIEKSSIMKEMCEEPSYYPETNITISIDSSWVSGNTGTKSKRLNRTRNSPTKMVYPFELVKPGGGEGDITLNDINRRIMMPPTQPLRHPVGDFASRSVVSTNGPGLSGKAVVGLTRIHTRGRGTITIIRTKG